MSSDTNEKKGISLVGFIVVLIILVCVEGFYIVKLKNNDSSTQPSTISKNDNTNDLLGDTPILNLSEINAVDENRRWFSSK